MTIITFSKIIQAMHALSADTDTNLVSFTYSANPGQGPLTMPWNQISATMYAVNFNGEYSTSWKIFKFNDATNVTVYNIPSDKISSSKLPTEKEVLSAIATITGTTGTYTGMLPIFQIEKSRNAINSQTEDLFKMQGTYAQSIESNYQSTLMMGLFVAMLGTTVLFYTFRQL
jgi:hypothetical protein